MAGLCVTVAIACRANGGIIAMEWPKGCSYWRERKVKTFLAGMGMQQYHFDGCMYGLCSSAPKTLGVPLRKPWTVASDCNSFLRLCRTCDHPPSGHVKTQGIDTSRTENYTDPLVHGIHDCWRLACA